MIARKYTYIEDEKLYVLIQSSNNNRDNDNLMINISHFRLSVEVKVAANLEMACGRYVESSTVVGF